MWDTDRRRHVGHRSHVRTALAEAGVSHTDLVRELDGWLSSAPGRRLEGALGYGLPHELWMAATAVAVWAPLPGEALSELPAPARTALAALAPGGLRTVVPQVLTDPGIREDLPALIRAAFAYGTRNRAPDTDRGLRPPTDEAAPEPRSDHDGTP